MSATDILAVDPFTSPAGNTPAEFYDKWLAPHTPDTIAFRRSLIVDVIEGHPDSADNAWRIALVAHIDSKVA